MFKNGDAIPAKVFVPIQGIYLIKNIENGKVYVGQSVNIQGRWTTHAADLSTQKHCNVVMQKEWDQYGARAFVMQVVEEVPQRKWLYTVERRWIVACHDAGLDLYNYDTSAERYIYYGDKYDICKRIVKEGYGKPEIDFKQISPSRDATRGVATPIPANLS